MTSRRDPRALAVLALLAASALALVVAPAALPPGYSWVEHTTSQAAAQGLHGAWVARSGFLLLGFGVLAASSVAAPRWGRWGSVLHRGFGVLMLATAAFAHRPLDLAAPVDEFEDLLHSVAATGVGFAFAVGVVVVALRRARATGTPPRVVDAVAVLASVAVPAVMGAVGDVAGLAQRAMFLVAYVWYATEALATTPTSP